MKPVFMEAKNVYGGLIWALSLLLLLLLWMAPGKVTGLARAISSLGIPFRAGMNIKVIEHQDPWIFSSTPYETHGVYEEEGQNTEACRNNSSFWEVLTV